MRQWEDWDQQLRLKLPSESPWIYAVLCLVTALPVVFFLLQWSTSNSYLEYQVDRPDRLDLGQQAKHTEAHAYEEVQSTTLRNLNYTDIQIRGSKIFPRCPADGQYLQTDPITPATPNDIDRSVRAATKAQEVWSATSFTQRRQVLRTLLHYVLTHQDDIATACCLDSGKTKIDASFGEVLVTAEKLTWTIKHGEAALESSRRPTNLLMCYKTNTVHYEPLGVVSACVSWNYPFHNLISLVISALFSGNAIVVKPSEQTAWSSLYFTEIIKGALTACGHSPDLVQTVICLPDVADHLTSHPDIKHITFIGSRPIAHKVAASASRSLTALTIELGGKDPAIILDDPRTISDLDSVASIILRGTFQSAG